MYKIGFATQYPRTKLEMYIAPLGLYVLFSEWNMQCYALLAEYKTGRAPLGNGKFTEGRGHYVVHQQIRFNNREQGNKAFEAAKKLFQDRQKPYQGRIDCYDQVPVNHVIQALKQ